MKRVLVTGAAGVIGSQLVELLIENEQQVIAADLKPRPTSFPDSVIYRRGDLNDLDVMELRDMDVEVIYHLAATFERTEETLSFFAENFRHNVQLTHHLLDLVNEVKTPVRFVFASSYLIYNSAVYKVEVGSGVVKLSEDNPVTPRNLTGFAKFSGEKELAFLQAYNEATLSGVSARIFRGFGLGSRDVISRWVRALLRGDGIEVFDQETVFDFIYCKDAASALYALGSVSDLEGVVNVGTGKATSVKSVVQILRKRFPNGDFRQLPESSTVEKSVANHELLTRSTGWVSKYSMDAAIDEIIDYESLSLQDGRG